MTPGGLNDNIIQCYYIHALMDFWTILIYIHTFFNSSMFWLFINLSNVKADDRIVWCLLINWFRKVLKLEQFIIKWNSSPSSFPHQLHFLCSLGIPLWHPLSTGSYVRYVSFKNICFFWFQGLRWLKLIWMIPRVWSLPWMERTECLVSPWVHMTRREARGKQNR